MMRIAALVVLGWGVAADNDDLLSAWRLRRDVTVAEPGESRFAELKLPLEVLAATGPLQRDVRLIGPEGAEVRYLIDRGGRRESRRSKAGKLIDATEFEKESSTWTIDFGEPFTFDEIILEIPGQDFTKRLRVEAADSTAGPWRTLREDAGVFDRLWGMRVHHTTIPLPAAETARLLRITSDDRTSPRVNVRGALAAGGRTSPGERWRFPCALEPAPSPDPRRSRFLLRLPPGLPLDAFEVTADDPLFLRTASLVNCGRGMIYRLKLDDASPAEESLAFPVEPSGEEALHLEIDNGDNPPLKNVRAAALGMAARLIFPAGKGPFTLYYGNASCRAPLYDLEVLRARLSESGALARAEPGPERPNPRHREAPPLPFVPTAGAPLEANQWTWSRSLPPAAAEGLYAVTLSPKDLSVLRPDLADLRIADGEDRQVPFLLEARASEAGVALQRTPETSHTRSVSRHRLDLPAGPDGKPMALPIDALRLDIAEPFFSRTTRLSCASPPEWSVDRITLFSGRLERKDSGTAPLRIPVKGRHGWMSLDIEDGDNAPLTVTAAFASVPLPRVVFKRKAGAGECRLLMGNPESPPPRYDIEVLRREVLASAAGPLEAGPLVPNAAHRRGFAEHLRRAPPTLLLWGGLVVAVLGLLLVTVRLLRKPAGGA